MNKTESNLTLKLHLGFWMFLIVSATNIWQVSSSSGYSFGTVVGNQRWGFGFVFKMCDSHHASSLIYDFKEQDNFGVQ